MSGVKIHWTETAEWDCQFTEADWKFLVEEMDGALPTDLSAESVATVKFWMRDNREVCEEVLTALRDHRSSTCLDAWSELDAARPVTS